MTREYLEELVNKKVDAIKPFSLHKAARKVVEMTSGFVNIIKYLGCKQGCKVFGKDEPEDAVCTFCDAVSSKNSKFTTVQGPNSDERNAQVQRSNRAKQPIYYVEIKGQLKSFFVHPQSVDNLRYGKRYVSVPGVHHDIQDSENYKIISKEDYLYDSVPTTNNQLMRETFILYGGLMTDGFIPRDHSVNNWSFTLFHMVLYSLSPRLR